VLAGRIPGFGKRDGRLWVTDFSKRASGLLLPLNARHQRDFYRISSPENDPVVEKLYSKIEDGIAPILRGIQEKLRGSTEPELERLYASMAIQWTRVRAFRPNLLSIAQTVNRAAMKKVLRRPASWEKLLKFGAQRRRPSNLCADPSPQW